MKIFTHISFRMKRVIQMDAGTRYISNYAFAINRNSSLFWYPTNSDVSSQELKEVVYNRIFHEVIE